MGSVVVAVTGASSGVGRATAQAFAREGATVGLIARGQEALSATAAEVQSLGGQPVVLECDVADPQAVEAAASELEQCGEHRGVGEQRDGERVRAHLGDHRRGVPQGD